MKNEKLYVNENFTRKSSQGRLSQTPLAGFPCEIFIYASPNAGNFNQLADNNGLERFVCPNLTMIELKAFEHGYGDRWRDDLSDSVGHHVLLLPILLISQSLNYQTLQ
jgi:hypothetical protein